MSIDNKVETLKEAISRIALSNGLISQDFKIKFTIDNKNIKSFNTVSVLSLEEAEEIINIILSDKFDEVVNNVTDYDKPLFLMAELILPV